MDELWDIGARGIIVTDIHACQLRDGLPVVSSDGSRFERCPSWRPRRGRIVAYGMAAVIVVGMIVVAIALPGGSGGFRTVDRIGLVLFGLVAAWFLHVLAHPRVSADEWSNCRQPVPSTAARVGGDRRGQLARGDPWVYLDLADGSVLPVMGIQAADGEHGRAMARAAHPRAGAHANASRRLALEARQWGSTWAWTLAYSSSPARTTPTRSIGRMPCSPIRRPPCRAQNAGPARARRQFSAVLIGLDGTEKKRWTGPVGRAGLHAIVDEMPMGSKRRASRPRGVSP